MNILFLRGFNNYFNRTVKKYTALADYKSNSMDYLDFDNINFNPNDGIITELIVGNASQTDMDHEEAVPLNFDAFGTPDYAVCYEGTSIIKYRWFVLESERLRSGQYRLALKRDVLAEHFNQIMDAPCFVEKGNITNINDPLLYNNESMTYNQIKKGEYELKDSTGTGWIVGYMAKNRANTPHNVSTQIAILDGVPTEYYDEEDLPFTVSTTGGTNTYVYTNDKIGVLLPFSSLGPGGGWNIFGITQGFKSLGNVKLDCDYKAKSSGRSSDGVNSNDAYTDLITWGYTTFDSSLSSAYSISFYDLYMGSGNLFSLTPSASNTNINVYSKKYLISSGNPADSGYNTNKVGTYVDFQNTSVSSSTLSSLKTLVNGYMANDNYGPKVFDVANYNNKYVKVGTDYYRMSFNATGKFRSDIFATTSTNAPTITALDSNIAQRHIKSGMSSTINTLLSNYATANSSLISTNSTATPGVQVVAVSPEYSIILTRVTVETIEVTLQTGKRKTYDCPADIFAIPYGSFKFKTASDSDVFTTQKEEGLALARAIAQELGSSVVYDLQLVPYVPSQIVRDLMEDSDTLILTDLETANYDVATRTVLGTTSTASFVLYPSSSKGTFDIPLVLDPYHDQTYSNALNYKISNESELCRLVSPNFNGMFEFSLAKNNGVTKFNVDYTYKPILPYIHVNPDFKFIYGQDWDDARGLICGGDFSLTFINDAWINYQNNNKNYQAIFNRQIENMDVNNQIAKEQLDWQTFAGYFGGGLTGAVGGAVAGAKVGGGYGAIAGAVGGAYMGTVGAVIGGEMDKDWLRRSQAEAKDYATDMFGYQLGNIKAMPYSLSRSESLTNNNKIYPILEVYGPTDKEITNLINKIRYNGMTIMAIGKLSDYKASSDFSLAYVQGQLIRLENINDDFHVTDAIYQEVKKGFYVPQGGN